jgi:general secretion pathway protein J
LNGIRTIRGDRVRRGNPYGRPSGFTLIELMISLTIVGLILVIVMGSLRIGVRAWERGEKDTEAHQRQRIVLDLVKRQMASAFPLEVTMGDETPFMLKGGDTSLDFVSCYPMATPDRSGMVYVRYRVRQGDAEGRERLSFYEKNIAFIDKEKGIGEVDEENFVDLIPEAERIRFAYLRSADDDEAPSEWQETWDPEKEKGLPLAVKVTFRENENAEPIHVIARMEPEPKE